jgi:hypothetical protein
MAKNDSLMSLLFGKKKSHKRKPASKVKKSKRKHIGYTVKKTKSGFRIVKVFTGKKYSNGRKLAPKKKVYKKKAMVKAALKKRQAKKKLSFGMKNKKTTRRRSSLRRNSYGVGGSYMPLSSFMSPYPYSVSSSPPWV